MKASILCLSLLAGCATLDAPLESGETVGEALVDDVASEASEGNPGVYALVAAAGSLLLGMIPRSRKNK